MNQFTEILEKAATKLGFPFDVNCSDKSEAAYLKIYKSESRDFYDALTVRLASHDACTSKSLSYEVQLDCGFEFDYADNIFTTTWGVDEDGDFSETCLDEEIVFEKENEMIEYMANCLVVKLR